MMQILVLLGMCFDAVVVFVTSQTLLFRLALAILCAGGKVFWEDEEISKLDNRLIQKSYIFKIIILIVFLNRECQKVLLKQQKKDSLCLRKCWQEQISLKKCMKSSNCY